MSILSQRIESERKLAGWTKTQTAKKLNLPLTTYANYEYGNREPDSATITAMSTLFGVSNDYLMGKSDIRTSTNGSSKQGTHTSTELNYEDLGLPYKGVISEDLNDTFRLLAQQYAEKHNLPKKDQ